MYHSILVGQDTSQESRQALSMALWIARSTRAQLTLIHQHGRKLPFVHPLPLEEMRAMLNERAQVCAREGVACTQQIAEGWTAQAFLGETRWHDLTVVGKHGASRAGRTHGPGSLTAALLASSPVPVLIAGQVPDEVTNLLVAFDGSPDACSALRIAASLALERGLRLHVVEAVAKRRSGDPLERARAYLDQCPGLESELQRVPGKPFDAVPAYIRDGDIHLPFLPALDRALFLHRLADTVLDETASSILVPAGRSPRID